VDVEYLVTKTFGDTKHLDTEEPRVNSHNEITIHPIKDSWNREEVIALIEKHRKETYNGYSSKKWIKENL